MLLGDDSTVLICTGIVVADDFAGVVATDDLATDDLAGGVADDLAGVVVTDDFAGVVAVMGTSLGADIAVKSIGQSLVPSPFAIDAFEG